MTSNSQDLKMSQCVPSWELDDNPTPISLPFHPNSHPNDSKTPDAVHSILDYEVAELTWQNGQLSMQGLGQPRPGRATGTLESIVNQAGQLAPCEARMTHDEIVPWYYHNRSIGPDTMTMDALVPSSNFVSGPSKYISEMNQGVPTCITGKSTHVESCGGSASFEGGKEVEERKVRKRARASQVVVAGEVCSRNQSVSVSETFGKESRYLGVDSIDLGFTSASFGSDSSLNSVDDRDSVSQARPQKKQAKMVKEMSGQNEQSKISTKRSRAAAIHNQSERKRRDKINQRMKTLQKLVPNSSKTDKASMLDEVIEYLKTLQAQVQMMSRMGMPHMMMPMTMQQQLQMAMMAQMGMGMGLGMGVMDMNTMGRPNIAGMPQVLNPAAFMPMASWDGGTNDRLPSSNAVLPDPMASFLTCQAQQPTTLDAYGRMAALYQQLHQHQQVPNSRP